MSFATLEMIYPQARGTRSSGRSGAIAAQALACHLLRIAYYVFRDETT